MTIISTILTTLETPDDQGNDWYAWASNQLSHSMIGAVFTGIFCFLISPLIGFYALMLYAVGKEISDLFVKVNPRALRDSLHDILFQMCGSWLAIGLFVPSAQLFTISAVMGFTLLADGVVSRINAK